MRLEGARAAEARGHVGGVDETNAVPFRIEARHVVADSQVQHIRSIDFGQTQQCQGWGDGLHHGADPEAHFERVGIAAVRSRRGFVVERAVLHEAQGDLPLRQDGTAESIKGPWWHARPQFGERSRRQPCRQFSGCDRLFFRDAHRVD
jgi:hypothetical protein